MLSGWIKYNAAWVISWAMWILHNPRVPLGIRLLIPLRLSNHPFLRYVNLLFWVLWACMNITDHTPWKLFTQFEFLRCLYEQKIMAIQISYFWDISRFVTWDTLGMAGIWPHLTKSEVYHLECWSLCMNLKSIYFCTPLNSMQQENTKINRVQNRPFLGIWVCEN